ncbi:MAG: double-strand break repair protein AddB [Rhodospirillaceae bacterium]|nr:double-strand break repair protein AddB [Rhodospirillaceae bacterium]
MTNSADTAASWRRLKKAGRPSVFTIPATEHFVEALADGLKAEAGDDPLSLARMTVLMPTRRACRALREAFLRLGHGTPVLLPRLIPLNDIDADEVELSGFTGLDLPPAIAPLRRQLLLAAMILKRDDISHDQAAALAAALAHLIDTLQTENIPFERLKTLVPDDYAVHWQQTLTFLEIVTQHWPRVLEAEGAADPAAHRNMIFAAQRSMWDSLAGQLPGPVIAAGSVGTIPATADLLDTVARLPKGCVVLPGLDLTLDDASWNAIDPPHPQFGLKHLLKRFGLERDAVLLWPGCAGFRHHARLRLVSELMRPAATTERWSDISLSQEALTGLERITAPTSREEAGTIAMAMREALETPGHTCALVTPDRTLALRVAGELERWGIDVDDSAGRDLSLTPVGMFLRLLAEMAASDLAPLPLLSVCKHPLAAAELDPLAFRDLTRLAERALLRGPRPAPGWEGLRGRIGDNPAKSKLERWIGRLERCTADFLALMREAAVPVAQLLDAHMRCAELLASTPEAAGPLRLWAGDDGEAAATFAAELAQACDVLPPIQPQSYPALFAGLLKGRVVRPRFGKHPRLSILGPLEARLQRFGTLILAGLNEGTWPAEPAPDPWMSRPMRAACGLASPEQRIGQSAHDIAEALCGPRVILSRAAKVDGTPTVPSRWLTRLDQVIAAAKLPPLDHESAWLHYARHVTRPERAPQAWSAPAPAPPVAARPRGLSVTQVETWMRDPYAIYARHILKLNALDPLEADVSAADYGTLIHAALQKVVAENVPAAKAEERLMAIGQELFAGSGVSPAVRAFWWPRFQRIARWFIAHDQARRARIKQSFVESKGQITLPTELPFTLSAQADRIDILKDGALAIIDYKTGVPPKEDEVRAGFAPQLPLEAVIALGSGFKDIPASQVSELAFWHLHGRDEGATERTIKGDIAGLVAAAREGLEKLVARFDDPATKYEARPHPDYAPRYSDYEHLARVKEWASGDGGDA